MKGVQWGFALGMILVVILVMIGSGLLGDVAGFDIKRYIGIQPDTGGGGGVGGGGGGVGGGIGTDIPWVIHYITKSTDSYHSYSDVAYSMASDIYNDFVAYGDDGRRIKCVPNFPFNRCLVGIGRFAKISSNYDIETAKKFPGVIPCSYMDEECVTTHLSQSSDLKVGAASFCGKFIANNKEVTFGNLGCYAADGNDNCPSLCPNADRVVVWRAYPGKLNDPVYDRLQDRILPKDDVEYFYQIVYSSNNYYIENFGRGGYNAKVPQGIGAADSALEDIAKSFREGGGRGSAHLWKQDFDPRRDMNIAGYWYPEARMVANYTLRFFIDQKDLNNYPLGVKLLAQFDKFTEPKQNQVFSLDFSQTCSSKENCISRVKSFEAEAISALSQDDYHFAYKGVGGANPDEVIRAHDLVGDDPYLRGGEMKKERVHIISVLGPNSPPKSYKDATPDGKHIQYRVIVNRWQIIDGDKINPNGPPPYTIAGNVKIHRDYSIIIYEEEV